jgi:pseudouridine-5'-phosphate glycosidase
VPPPDELEGAEEMTRQAVEELGDTKGGAVTPLLLARVAELSRGRSVDLNVDLVVNNARIAAQVAIAFLA